MTEAKIITNNHVFLIGRPPLNDFLNFIQQRTVDFKKSDRQKLVEEWNLANDKIKKLEEEQNGYADNPEVKPLPGELDSLVKGLKTDPAFMRSKYPLIPYEIGLVELDRLVVFQKHINLDYVEKLKESLSADPSIKEIFRFALLGEFIKPEMSVGRASHNAFIFSSPSNDLRFLDVELIDSSMNNGQLDTGRKFSTIALHIGFGLNLLNAMEVNNRLVLKNGSHRAYALRDLGITHAPCVIQKVTRKDELEFIGVRQILDHPERYLSEKRPPVFKDYFNSEIRKIVDVLAQNRQIKVSFGVESVYVPA